MIIIANGHLLILIIIMKHLFMKSKKSTNPKWGKYKLMSHGYLAHEGEKSQGNVVIYHHYDIPMSK
jgi:hypothetical protein